MVQRQKRVVAGRAAVVVLGLAGIYSCAALTALGMGQTPPDCPSAIRTADAWINAMPTVGAQPDRKLIVSLRLDDPRPWTLTPVETDDEGLLALELAPGGDAVAGTAAYRAPRGAPRRQAVSITCGGEEMRRIDKILIAQ